MKRASFDPYGCPLAPGAIPGALGAASLSERGIGLVTHVYPDDRIIEETLTWAQRIAAITMQAVDDTRRILNINMQRAVLATIDFALTAVYCSLATRESRANIDRFLSRGKD